MHGTGVPAGRASCAYYLLCILPPQEHKVVLKNRLQFPHDATYSYRNMYSTCSRGLNVLLEHWVRWISNISTCCMPPLTSNSGWKTHVLCCSSKDVPLAPTVVGHDACERVVQQAAPCVAKSLMPCCAWVCGLTVRVARQRNNGQVRAADAPWGA